MWKEFSESLEMNGYKMKFSKRFVTAKTEGNLD